MKQLDTVDLVVGGVYARIRKMQAAVNLRPNMDKVTEQIWIGGKNKPESVESQKFNVVFDLREKEDPEYQTLLRNHNIEYLNFKIPDRNGASPEVLLQIASAINKKVNENRKILVHCNLGRGRSALAVAAYLVSKGKPPREALETIKKSRSVTHLNCKQMQALTDFAEIVSKTLTKNKK